MKRLLLIAATLIGLTGCEDDKRPLAQSQVNQLAETWDGGPKFTAEGTDPWGQAYTAKVEKDETHYHLTVRSNGPDKLPFTGDDIVATRSHKHTAVSEVMAPAIERVGEAIGKGLGRGGAAGVKEGITGKKAEPKKDDKKPEEKKDAKKE
jgi:hypothetical protein